MKTQKDMYNTYPQYLISDIPVIHVFIQMELNLSIVGINHESNIHRVWPYVHGLGKVGNELKQQGPVVVRAIGRVVVTDAARGVDDEHHVCFAKVTSWKMKTRYDLNV